MGLLEGINSPEDLKKLDYSKLPELADEIREFLINVVSRTGGHIASNLGVVELTLALHYVFNTPEDKIIWDVGHQSYVHKILTGRKDRFYTLRQMDGISGFPKTCESVHDCFNTGHSSTAISAALGMAKARDIKKDRYSVVAVVGDGALTGGMAFEALNDAGRSDNDLIVVLNDNEMSIEKNVGGLSKYLGRIRSEPFYSKAKNDFDNFLLKIPAVGKKAVKALSAAKDSIKYLIVPGMLFEELGFTYIGPIDGHDVVDLIKVFGRARRMKGPVLIHVCTVKGKGYIHAENKPDQFHGISPFEIETGEVLNNGGPGYSEIFGRHLVSLAEKDPSIAAITAAMPHGTGLSRFAERFPERFFDVGIAEQHAVTFAAGLAKCGLKPVVAIYSSFLQRAYDQILHDVALQNLHVVFAIDRAGVVGEDGETHQGLYDISYLSHIPNMTIMAPCDYEELRSMLEFALREIRGPVAIRYPRGTGQEKLLEQNPVAFGKGILVRKGNDLTIISLGNMCTTALEAESILRKNGYSVEIINARFVKPLDEETIISSAMKTRNVFTLEDNALIGGFGSRVLALLCEKDVKVNFKAFGYPDQPIPHGPRKMLMEKYGLDAPSIAEKIMNCCSKS